MERNLEEGNDQLLLPHILQLPFWQQQRATHVGDRDELAQANSLVEGRMLLSDLFWGFFACFAHCIAFEVSLQT